MATMALEKTSERRLAPKVKAPTAAVLGKLSQRDRDLIVAALEESVEYVDDPCFRSRGIERLLFPPGVDHSKRTVDEILDDPSAVQMGIATMSAEEEKLAFLRFNYARYRVYRILRHHHGRRLTAAGARKLIVWRRRVLCSRSTIIQANLPLVLAMAKRTRLSGVDYNELISEGNMALLRSVAKFDCSRGFKFSTYACRAILKSFSRVSVKAARYRCRFPTEFEPEFEKSDYLEVKREAEHGDCMEELRSVLSHNLADLSETEWTVINSRFALIPDGDGMPVPKTLEQVGSIIGVTKERVRQIQNKALRKLRAALEENIAAA